MKKLLLAIALLSSLSSLAQSLIGKNPRIVTAYLEDSKINHRAVYDSRGQMAFIVRDMEDGDAVYYFKDEECVSYSIVKYDLRRQFVEWSLDQRFRRDGNVWCNDAENAYITVVETHGSVYINVLGPKGLCRGGRH